MLGGDVCSACGVCFNIINAGIAAPNGPGGDTPQGAANQQIKVWIVNSCLDCQPVSHLSSYNHHLYPSWLPSKLD